MNVGNRQTGVRLRVVIEPRIAIGPGKADLLAAIDRCGSISGAGRELGMSYRRAWNLVNNMNLDFNSPVVETSKGGSGRGGARLSELGRKVLGIYRRMESKVQKSTAKDFAALKALYHESK